MSAKGHVKGNLIIVKDSFAEMVITRKCGDSYIILVSLDDLEKIRKYTWFMDISNSIDIY
jgi:hypothetical protein